MTIFKNETKQNYNLSSKLIEMLLSIERNLDSDISLESLSKEMNYSKYHFLRIFKQCTGVTTYEYIKKRRLYLASKEILNGNRIIDAALNNGYDSSSAFSRAFKKTFGITPQILKLLSSNIKSEEGVIVMNNIFNKTIDNTLTVNALYGILVDTIRENCIDCDMDKLNHIIEFSKQNFTGLKRYSGEEYFCHPLNIAILLADLEVTKEVIYGALVVDLLNKTNVSEQTILEAIGQKAYEIVKVSSLVGTEYFNGNVSDEMSQNAVLLKLVERLHNMRTIESLPKDKQVLKAKETLEVFLPLTSVINNEKIKDELNDLSIKVYSEKQL